MEDLIIFGIDFPEDVTSDSARRLLKRMDIEPIAQGGRTKQGWLQYPLAEETSTRPASRTELALGKLRLRIGLRK